MKIALIIIVLLAAIGGGVAWFFFLSDPPPAEEADETPLAVFDDPVYYRPDTIVAPIFGDNSAAGSLAVNLVVEVASEGAKLDAYAKSAALHDALLADLYEVAERFRGYGVEPEFVTVKQRFRAIVERVLGADIVHDVLIQDFVHIRN